MFSYKQSSIGIYTYLIPRSDQLHFFCNVLGVADLSRSFSAAVNRKISFHMRYSCAKCGLGSIFVKEELYIVNNSSYNQYSDIHVNPTPISQRPAVLG
jgi:hypothetical protein